VEVRAVRLSPISAVDLAADVVTAVT
jgi:hypothetical protein